DRSARPPGDLRARPPQRALGRRDQDHQPPAAARTGRGQLTRSPPSQGQRAPFVAGRAWLKRRLRVVRRALVIEPDDDIGGPVQVIKHLPNPVESLETLAVLDASHLHHGGDGGLVGALENPCRDKPRVIEEAAEHLVESPSCGRRFGRVNLPHVDEHGTLVHRPTSLSSLTPSWWPGQGRIVPRSYFAPRRGHQRPTLHPRPCGPDGPCLTARNRYR